MEIYHNSVEPVRAYLLGTLPEEQAVTLEGKYFTDRDFLLRVQAVETGLIEDYLNGQLPADTLESFESRYLCVPELRRRLEEVRGSRTAAAGSRQRLLFVGWRPIMVAVLVCVAGATFLTYVHFRNVGGELNGQGDQPPGPAPMQVLLQPGLTKGDGNAKMKEFTLPAPGTRIQFLLELPGEAMQAHAGAQILVPGENGQLSKVWSWTSLSELPSPKGQAQFFVEIDAVKLRALDYVLQILKPDGAVVQSYVFRVTPRGSPRASMFDPATTLMLPSYFDPESPLPRKLEQNELREYSRETPGDRRTV
jgi:hypothetical protein